MKNKTVLITGATDGIGLQTAMELSAAGARVLVHGRNVQKTDDVVSRIQAKGGDALALTADLSSMKEVKKLSEKALSAFPLDVLINNAGVFMKEKTLTADGLEMTFAVNHLAHFLLTRELLPHLKNGARIITLSSIAHRRGQIDFENLEAEKSFNGYASYAMSKLCNVLFSNCLAEKARERGIFSNAVHPGVIQTKLLKTGFNMDTAGSLKEGAATSVYLASSAQAEGVTGKYFVNCAQSSSVDIAGNEELQQLLWDHSEKLLAR